MLENARYWLQRLANPAVFVLRIKGGVAQLTKGRAPAAFVEACTGIAADFGIDRGYVEGMCTWRGPTLRFSPGVPASSHQRFRNACGAHLTRLS